MTNIVIFERKNSTFIQRPDGIFVIELLNDSTQTAIDMVDYFEYLAVQTAPLHRILIDLSKTSISHPLGYSFAKLRDVMKRYPNRPMGWVAVIMHSNAMISLVNTLMGLLTRRGEKFRIFVPSQLPDALDWLAVE